MRLACSLQIRAATLLPAFSCILASCLAASLASACRPRLIAAAMRSRTRACRTPGGGRWTSSAMPVSGAPATRSVDRGGGPAETAGVLFFPNRNDSRPIDASAVDGLICTDASTAGKRIGRRIVQKSARRPIDAQPPPKQQSPQAMQRRPVHFVSHRAPGKLGPRTKGPTFWRPLDLHRHLEGLLQPYDNRPGV
jgi:hypothetical protein